MTDLVLSHCEEVETRSSVACRLFQMFFYLRRYSCTDRGKSYICCPVLVFVKVDVTSKVTCETI